MANGTGGVNHSRNAAPISGTPRSRSNTPRIPPSGSLQQRNVRQTSTPRNNPMGGGMQTTAVRGRQPRATPPFGVTSARFTSFGGIYANIITNRAVRTNQTSVRTNPPCRNSSRSIFQHQNQPRSHSLLMNLRTQTTDRQTPTSTAASMNSLASTPVTTISPALTTPETATTRCSTPIPSTSTSTSTSAIRKSILKSSSGMSVSLPSIYTSNAATSNDSDTSNENITASSRNLSATREPSYAQTTSGWRVQVRKKYRAKSTEKLTSSLTSLNSTPLGQKRHPPLSTTASKKPVSRVRPTPRTNSQSTQNLPLPSLQTSTQLQPLPSTSSTSQTNIPSSEHALPSLDTALNNISSTLGSPRTDGANTGESSDSESESESSSN